MAWLVTATGVWDDSNELLRRNNLNTQLIHSTCQLFGSPRNDVVKCVT